VAEELGVTAVTLSTWRKSGGTKLARVDVVVAELEQPRRGAVVFGPRGMRVEGLGVDDIAALWRRLS